MKWGDPSTAKVGGYRFASVPCRRHHLFSRMFLHLRRVTQVSRGGGHPWSRGKTPEKREGGDVDTYVPLRGNTGVKSG